MYERYEGARGSTVLGVRGRSNDESGDPISPRAPGTSLRGLTRKRSEPPVTAGTRHISLSESGEGGAGIPRCRSCGAFERRVSESCAKARCHRVDASQVQIGFRSVTSCGGQSGVTPEPEAILPMAGLPRT